MDVALKWAKIEIMRFIREPVSLFFTLIFPILLIYIFGDSFGAETSSDGVNYYNSLVSIDVSFLISNFTLMGIGNDLANQKENGITDSMRLLPIHTWLHTVIQSVSYLLLLFISTGLLTVYVYIRYEDIVFQGNIVAYAFFMVISYFFFVNLTKFMISFSFSARTLQLINSTVFFCFLFCSGIVIPKESLPEILQKIVDYSPLYVTYKVLESIWNNSFSEWTYFRGSMYLLILALAFYVFVFLKRQTRIKMKNRQVRES